MSGMAPTKTDKLSLRLSPKQRADVERAAALEGQSVSALVTRAAEDRAREILHAHSSMVVPTDVFDQLLAQLDEPPRPLAPALVKALETFPGVVEQR
jgi:uncharacterized protein (DUF1778 family)